MLANNEGQLEFKIIEFTHAMEQYLGHWFYRRFERVVSIFIMVLQLITLFNLLRSQQDFSSLSVLSAIIIAYLATDFINGLVHMFMDNNTSYSSIFGPYIAAFHLHHAKYIYQVRHPVKVYFYESGTKFWLVVYLFIVLVFQLYGHLSSTLQIGLVAVGIFSSLAEVSHYWCHNATKKNTIILWLQDKRILLSKAHHAAHHQADNTQYAFLNGATDPLLNLIARYCYSGYKNYSDKHTRAYIASSTKF